MGIFYPLHSLRRCTILSGQQLRLLYARLGRFLPKLGPCLSRPLFLTALCFGMPEEVACLFGSQRAGAKNLEGMVAKIDHQLGHKTLDRAESGTSFVSGLVHVEGAIDLDLQSVPTD